ncbi:hypothetical protein D3C76_1247340 [compost metagenome]
MQQMESITSLNLEYKYAKGMSLSYYSSANIPFYSFEINLLKRLQQRNYLIQLLVQRISIGEIIRFKIVGEYMTRLNSR